MKPKNLSSLLLLVLLGAGVGAIVDALLNLGDTFKGTISSADDVDIIEFDAVSGSVITLTASADKKQILLPRLQVIDLTTAGSLIDAASGGKRTVVKNLSLPSTGRYQVLISGTEATTGTYTLKTKGRLPGALTKQTLVEEIAAGGPFTLQFDAAPDYVLSATLGPDRKSDGAAGNPRLEGPGESPIPLTGFFTQKNDKIIIKDVVLPDLGTYTLTVDNVGATGDMHGQTKIKPPKIKSTTVEESPEN